MQPADPTKSNDVAATQQTMSKAQKQVTAVYQILTYKSASFTWRCCDWEPPAHKALLSWPWRLRLSSDNDTPAPSCTFSKVQGNNFYTECF